MTKTSNRNHALEFRFVLTSSQVKERLRDRLRDRTTRAQAQDIRIRTGRNQNDERNQNAGTRRRQRARTDDAGGRARCVDKLMEYDADTYRKIEEDLKNPKKCVGELGGYKGLGPSKGRCAILETEAKARCMCTFCGALLFRAETKKARTIGPYGTIWHGKTLCCSEGTVSLPAVKRDSRIESIWQQFGAELRKSARPFNNSLAMASMPVKVPRMPGNSNYSPSVCIQGKLHHMVATLALPTNSSKPAAFAQLYVNDPALGDVTERRAANGGFVNASNSEKETIKKILKLLNSALLKCNPYVKDIMTAAEVFRTIRDEDLIDATFAIDNSSRRAKRSGFEYETKRSRFNYENVAPRNCAWTDR